MLALHFAALYYCCILFGLPLKVFSVFDDPAIGLDQWWDRIDYLRSLVSIDEHPFGDFFSEERRILLTESFSRVGSTQISYFSYDFFMLSKFFAWFSCCDFQVAKGRDERPGGVLTDFFREGKNSAHGIILAHVSSSACRRRCG